MKSLTLSLFALFVVLAVPATAAPPDDAPAVSEATPTETAPATETAPGAVEAPYTPAQAGKIQLGEIGALGSCSATADCAGGGSVSCSAQSGSCWFLDGCYAVCDGSYHWCGYRPNPCPV